MTTPATNATERVGSRKRPWGIVLSALVLVALGGTTATWVKVGRQPDGSVIVTTGQRLRPEGAVLPLGTRALDMALSPDGQRLAVLVADAVVIVDTRTWRETQRLALGKASFAGVWWQPDGRRLYASRGSEGLAVFGWDGESARAETAISLPANAAPGAGAVDAAGETLAVPLFNRHSVALIALPEGKLTAEVPVGSSPYGALPLPDGRKLYVTNWAGHKPLPDEVTNGVFPVAVRPDGTVADGTVTVVDLVERSALRSIRVGRQPTAMLYDARRSWLYVANGGDDTVSVIDTRTDRVLRSVRTRGADALPYGSAPNALALTPDGRSLLVANAAENVVAVLALPTVRRTGLIPTEWYPAALALDAAGKRLWIANNKGIGSLGDAPASRVRHLKAVTGSLQSVAWPLSERSVPRLASQVGDDNHWPRALEALRPPLPAAGARPVPSRRGEPSVFRHVLYVIKENLAYDAVLGDLPQGNGAPDLVLYGRQVTPNHHALAEQFTLLDNFYCTGINSADGHTWVTQCYENNYMERIYGLYPRAYVWDEDPLGVSTAGFLWDNALRHGKTFRNFGEYVYSTLVDDKQGWFDAYAEWQAGRPVRFTGKSRIASLQRHTDAAFPGWNMKIPDQVRADRFLQWFRETERTGQLPDLTILFLPNDHGMGTQPGYPTAQAMAADNDRALGRVVDAVTHSRFWPSTAIFILEDDAQNGYDHVDGHRSPAFVISPYTRRGVVDHTFYHTGSMVHTIERILGLPAMTQLDLAAPLMTSVFMERPDFRPYTALPNAMPLDTPNPTPGKNPAALPRWDPRGPDRVDWHAVRRLVWRAVKGRAPLPVDRHGDEAEEGEVE